MKYPDMITPDILKQYAHLSNAEISNDIRDLISEIKTLAIQEVPQAALEDRRNRVTFLNNILVKRMEDPLS